MNKSKIYFAMLAIYLLLAASVWANTKSKNEKADNLKIVVTLLEIDNNTLNIFYEIRNDSEQEVWICENCNVGSSKFEVYMTDNDQTLLIRRRLDVPMEGFGEQIFGRYTCIHIGEIRKESLLLPLPVRPQYIFAGLRYPQPTNIEHAKRLSIEIGFYSGDLSEMIFDILNKAEKDPHKKHTDDIGYPTDVIGWLISSIYFNSINDGRLNRDEQVKIPWTNQTLKGEQILKMTIDNLQIPYEEKIEPIRYSQSDLRSCNRMEITYQPSILEYFFPYEEQKILMSNFEKQHLQSQKTINVSDRNFIKTLSDEIMNGFLGGEIITGTKVSAQVICYRDDDFLTSFSIINNQYIETKERQSYSCYGGLESMRMSVPQIVLPFQSRIQCATNLKDLWYRLRLYNKVRQIHVNVSKNIIEFKDPLPTVYPTPKEWCDNLTQAFRVEGRKEWIMKAHKCPAAGEGKCHYAMNPNCEPNSLGDMVLLFETKAGWNQHGGPELFTFDNHNPKGGCVLLNDGTVKFIRTKEELNTLRWK